MSSSQARLAGLTRAAATLAALTLPTAVTVRADADQPAAAQSSLEECAVIEAAAARLDCYDRLAGRGMPTRAASEPRPAPVAAAPGAAAQPAAPPRPEGKGSFGLYSAEHPAPPPVSPTLATHVAGLGRSPNGHTTVTVEDGGVWELEEADPILAVGDAVTINRGALGSFLMRTPAKRSHRVRRLH